MMMTEMTAFKWLLFGLLCASTIVSTKAECEDECECHGFKYLSKEVVDDLCSLSKYNTKCPVTCETCSTTTTTKPVVVTKPTTTKPITTKATTAKPTTVKPTTTKPTTTKAPTTTEPKTVGPIEGGCGDKFGYCATLNQFDATSKTEQCNVGYSEFCPGSCDACTVTEASKCANLVDDNFQCNTRNCQDADPVMKHRIHKWCPKTCCQKGQLNRDTLDGLDMDGFHPKLLSLNMHT